MSFDFFSIVLIDDTSNHVHIVLRPDIIPFQPSTSIPINAGESASNRLEDLRRFLSSKRIPFQEKQEDNQSITLVIQNGIVQINAPYTSQTIVGTNEIVLSRMKFLLKPILN